MKKVWLYCSDRFDGLQPRERLAVFLCLVMVVAGGFYALTINPLLGRYQQAHQSLQSSAVALAAQQQQEQALMLQAARNPNQEATAELNQVSAQNAALRAELANAQGQLAAPEKMVAVLRELIGAQKGLELVNIRSMPAENILPAAAMSGPAAAAGIFRHGVELKVRGDYAALAAYLRQVEALPAHLTVDEVSLRSGQYPNNDMTVKLSTLSLERAWIGF